MVKVNPVRKLERGIRPRPRNIKFETPIPAQRVRLSNGVNKFGWLIAFKLKPGLTSLERTVFFRHLYGYLDYSQYGKYRYRRKGYFSTIPYVRLGRAVFIIRLQDGKPILKILKAKAYVYCRKVCLTSTDRQVLFGKKRARRSNGRSSG